MLMERKKQDMKGSGSCERQRFRCILSNHPEMRETSHRGSELERLSRHASACAGGLVSRLRAVEIQGP